MGVACEITLFGGVGEIGGNAVLIEDKKAGRRLLFDYGVNYRVFKRYFEFPFNPPRDHDELIQLGAIPDPRKIGRVDACFITHLHGDHYKYPAISSITNQLYLPDKRMLDIRLDYLNRHNRLYFELEKPSPDLRLNETTPGEYHDRFDVATRACLHNTIANSYALITDIGLIAYTGDFRLHGRECEKCERKDACGLYKIHEEYSLTSLIEEISQRPKILICEGTNLGRNPTPLTELKVENKLAHLIERCKGLVIIDAHPLDIERAVSIGRACREVAVKTGVPRVLGGW